MGAQHPRARRFRRRAITDESNAFADRSRNECGYKSGDPKTRKARGHTLDGPRSCRCIATGEPVDLEVDEARHHRVAGLRDSGRPCHIDLSLTYPGNALVLDQHAREWKLFARCEHATVKQDPTHAFGTIGGMFAPTVIAA